MDIQRRIKGIGTDMEHKASEMKGRVEQKVSDIKSERMANKRAKKKDDYDFHADQ